MKQPVIIVGAPRSGTNMLRDMLVKLDKVETWPCDEINYIWRHGNVNFPSDQFSREQATPKVKKYLVEQFDKFQETSKCDVVVEKTCASSLRVDFIEEIFPNAKYIFIVRDGIDAVGSAKLRWTAALDLSYILKKVKYVPLSDLPYYAGRFLFHRMFKLFTKEKRLGSWGPVLPNMQEIVANRNLLEVCGIQWQACVKKAKNDLSIIESSRVLFVKYEDFVLSPCKEFERLALFIDKKPSDIVIKEVTSKTSSNSIRKGRKALSQSEFENVLSIIELELSSFGYDTKVK